jgi:hypothetical protein
MADLGIMTGLDQGIDPTIRPFQCSTQTDCDPYLCQCRTGNITLFQVCIDNECVYDDVEICNEGNACNGQGGAQSARPYLPFSGASCTQVEDCPTYSCLCQDQSTQDLQICLNGICLASQYDCRTWDIESQFLEQSNISCIPQGGSQ